MAEQQAKASSQGVDATNSSNQEVRENEKNPAISNPRWEDTKGQAITKALVGDEVYLCADITDIAEGVTATIKIVEKDADGKDDPVATLSAVVRDGQLKCQWKDLPLAPGTMEKYGCKITAAAKIVCTITGNGSFDPARFLGMDSNIQGTEGPGLTFEKYVDDNGNLSQEGIMNAMGRANPSVEVKPDYFEKTLGHAILKELKEDEDYIHYILGRAQIGGGLGQHWVVIEDYSVTEKGVIRYECIGSSNNDAGREFTSDTNAASGTNKKLAWVDKIEVYSVRRK